MENLESAIKKHKSKFILQGIGTGTFAIAGSLLTYALVDVLSKNYEKFTAIDLLPLSEQAGFGDLMFANAVAWGISYGLSKYARENYKKVKELRQRQEIKKYF